MAIATRPGHIFTEAAPNIFSPLQELRRQSSTRSAKTCRPRGPGCAGNRHLQNGFCAGKRHFGQRPLAPGVAVVRQMAIMKTPRRETAQDLAMHTTPRTVYIS